MVDFLPLCFKNWVKEGKEKQQNIEIIDFFGTPYVWHIRKDLKTQIFNILRTNSEFLILKFSGTTFVFVKWSNFVALLNTFISKTFTKFITDFIWDLTNFIIEMLQLWYLFTWAILKVGIKSRVVLESAWTAILRIGWLFTSTF